MAADIKNFAGGDTGTAKNGRTSIKSAQTGNIQQQSDTLNSSGFTEFTIADFDNSPPGTNLSIRLDDPNHSRSA